MTLALQINSMSTTLDANSISIGIIFLKIKDNIIIPRSRLVDIVATSTIRNNLNEHEMNGENSIGIVPSP